MDGKKRHGMLRRRRQPQRIGLVLVIVAAATMFLVSGSTVGQINDPEDPRNKALGEEFGGTPSADCWKHHQGEGMRDAFIIVPILPQQLVQGEAADAKVQIVNPWKNDVRGLTMKVNIPSQEERAPIITVPGAASGDAGGPEDAFYSFEGSVTRNASSAAGDQWVQETFLVEEGVTRIVLFMTLNFVESTPAGGNPVSMVTHLIGPNQNIGTQVGTRGDDRAENRQLVLDVNDEATRSSLQTGGTGDWQVAFKWQSGDAGDRVDYSITAQVFYGAGGDQLSYAISSLSFDLNIPPQSSTVVDFQLLGLAPGDQNVEIELRGEVFYELGHKDGVTANEDNYTRYATRTVAVGDEFIPPLGDVVEVSAAGDDFRLVSGEVLGFASAILLVPSLLFGGTFGKGSRKFFNTLLGGAKRRVMYHSLVSLGLTIAALVHIVFFFLEIRYSVLMGVLWGGLGAVALMVLGLTGYYQVPLIQKQGYKWWRYTHLVTGVLVLVFVGLHSIWDGAHFHFVKETLPEWLTRINLSDK